MESDKKVIEAIVLSEFSFSKRKDAKTQRKLTIKSINITFASLRLCGFSLSHVRMPELLKIKIRDTLLELQSCVSYPWCKYDK